MQFIFENCIKNYLRFSSLDLSFSLSLSVPLTLRLIRVSFLMERTSTATMENKRTCSFAHGTFDVYSVFRMMEDCTSDRVNLAQPRNVMVMYYVSSCTDHVCRKFFNSSLLARHYSISSRIRANISLARVKCMS